MDLKKASFFGDSPPYLPNEDLFFFPRSLSTIWNGLTFATPPLSPVDTTSSDKEVISHLSSHSNEPRALKEDPLPEELFSNSNARDISIGRAESPAILNDIMWNAGQRCKRPDSAMDLDVRFNLNATPIAFEQPIASTFVDSDDLFSFSLFESYDSQEDKSDGCRNERDIASSPLQDLSDSDEEIDVVGLQVLPKQEDKRTLATSTTPTKSIVCQHGEQSSKNVETMRLKPRIALQRTKDKKEESSASDSDCENTRISHNDLERKRRNELRNRFNYLRENIPSLMNNEKAAKIAILRKAYELIMGLEKEEKEMVAEKDFERQKNAELLRRLVKFTRASKRS